MSRSRPWMKFYPADWRADPALRMCSYAARGLWADLMCLMHESEHYGHLLIAGIQPTAAQLAAVLGGRAGEISKLLAELESAAVFSRLTDGTIYSRRMVRDKAKADQDERNGRQGGNPNITGEDNGGVNPTFNQEPNPPDKAQKPESRYQKESTPPCIPPPGGKPKRAKPRSAIKPERLPDEQDFAFALAKEVDASTEWPKFLNHHQSKATLSADWHASWRTWCLNAHKFAGNGHAKPDLRQRPSHDPQAIEAAIAAGIEAGKVPH